MIFRSQYSQSVKLCPVSSFILGFAKPLVVSYEMLSGVDEKVAAEWYAPERATPEEYV